MQKIKSFELDHNIMTPGFYNLGETRGVTTFDLRFKAPNGGDYLDIAAIHSIEHMFASVVRNSDIKSSVVYFGPMGCRTGFYLLLFDLNAAQAKAATLECMKKCIELETLPGAEQIECGNFREHDFEKAKKEIVNYVKVLEG